MTSTNDTNPRDTLDAVHELNASDVDMPEGVLDSLSPADAQRARDHARFMREVYRLDRERQARS